MTPDTNDVTVCNHDLSLPTVVPAVLLNNQFQTYHQSISYIYDKRKSVDSGMPHLAGTVHKVTETRKRTGKSGDDF
jgi:hypothetical protein